MTNRAQKIMDEMMQLRRNWQAIHDEQGRIGPLAVQSGQTLSAYRVAASQKMKVEKRIEALMIAAAQLPVEEFNPNCAGHRDA